MKIGFSILSLLFFIQGFTQGSLPANLIPEKTDSIQFTAAINVTKEMTLPSKEPYYQKLGSVVLSKIEQKKFTKKLKKSASFDKNRALLTHYNLAFMFYTDANLELEIHLSTLTRNIDAFGGKNGVFHGKISQKMGRFILKMVTTFGFYNQLNERGDLEGLQ